MAASSKKNETQIALSDGLTALKGIGPQKAERFKKLGIETFYDALSFYPREYEDYRNKKQIADLGNDDKAVVIARVLLARLGGGFGRNRTLHVLAEDSTGRMEVLFFQGAYFIKQFQPGTMFSFFGKVKVENGRVTMFHPSYSRADSAAEDGILPVYPLTSGLSQKDLRMCTKAALLHADELAETLPAEAVRSANLCSNAYALKNIHYPEGDDQYRASRYRLVYEELFCLDTALAISKDRGGLGRKGNSMKGDHAYEFVKTLPYELTGAQKRVLSEILVDMASEKAMNRLVQGDVGSGKTAVAAAAMVQSAGNGYQSAFMAPTDILARQHFATLTKLFSGLGVHVVLLTSGMPSAEKKEALRQIKD
ncbi:MAG: DEAD/DEAH box helicase, partial [Lachnospiraceae bacterium]|nr:DEAD/DEAH box helicase [Lachnospiraceae bacterium]